MAEYIGNAYIATATASYCSADGCACPLCGKESPPCNPHCGIVACPTASCGGDSCLVAGCGTAGCGSNGCLGAVCIAAACPMALCVVDLCQGNVCFMCFVDIVPWSDDFSDN